MIFKQDGFYDELLALFERIIRERFMHDTIRQKFAVARSVEEIFLLLDTWNHAPTEKPWFETK